MKDRIEDSQQEERTAALIEALVADLPEPEKSDERENWRRHFLLQNLIAEKAAGRRGIWWPDATYGVHLYELDPIEWAEVEESADAGARRCFGEITGISDEGNDWKTMVLRLAEIGEDFAPVLASLLLSATPEPAFWETLAKAQREGQGNRRRLPVHDRLFEPRTMRDEASFFLTFFWDRGIPLPSLELPPFALWTDEALADYFQETMEFPAGWQAIRDRRVFYGLKQPAVILVDRVDLVRAGGEGEEIAIREGSLRIGYCRKPRKRKGKATRDAL